MAVHFHPLQIKSVSKETPECVSVEFDIPEDIASVFSFKEGQNITIKKNMGGNEIRRSYSICTAPHEKVLRVAIKKVEGGLFSQFANEELKEGMSLDVLPPTGNFYARIKDEHAHYLAIAAGSGITPVISIIKHTLHTQPESRFTLVYGNRSRSSIIFFDELESLKNLFMDRFNLLYILSREKTDADINYGRIDKQKLSALSRLIPFRTFKSIYLCGPEEMIFASAAFLEELGIDKASIHFELFTIPGQAASQKITQVVDEEKATGPESQISIKLDGRTFDFGLSFNGQSILDKALQLGADLPYACKGGVCCSCKAKLIQGKVEMDVNYALEPEEVKEGFILACQSHPRSEKIVIDFDIK